MDYNIFQQIHGLARLNSTLDFIMSTLSTWGYIAFILAIIVLPFLPSKRKLGLLGFLALLITLGLNRILKWMIDRPRPFVDHDIDILVPKEPSPSFPSDQALIAGVFVTIYCLRFADLKLRLLAISLAVLVVISRVFVGHHYPADVVAGMFLGIIIVAIVHKIGMQILNKQAKAKISA
ncbi:phosphatase PAP2 family protein [Aquibacillus albus]|uniref:Undecaprenyl-diphosphatase n=1 Tax=Aquibacillus albus TaxID=1168171 RepID=A0ABS2MWM2_9BACI|nr:phosphatase PAP2 family protein [Aquibacillus albus]MBM7570267.1 undecaprenyl-diphosphatase [Aquibacillus albus]